MRGGEVRVAFPPELAAGENVCEDQEGGLDAGGGGCGGGGNQRGMEEG